MEHSPYDGPRVVVLVLDGVRDEESFGDTWSQVVDGPPSELMPRTWEQLVPQGSRATHVHSAGLTLTGPGHATMLSGVRQAFGNYEVLDEPGAYRPELPTIFEELRIQKGISKQRVSFAANASLVQPMASSNTPGMGYELGANFRLVGDQAPDVDVERGGTKDNVVFDVLETLVSRRQPALLVANLHQVDRATHGVGEHTYADHLEILDQRLPDFVAWLYERRATQEDAWVFVVSDHGRHHEAGTDPPWQSHGDACLGCRGIPWFVMGPGVEADRALDTPLLLEDLAPTAAALLDIDLPWAEGRVARDFFSQDLPVDRTGVAERVVLEDSVAEVVFLDDRDHRSEVRLDGERLSPPEAVLAGGLAGLQDGDRDWLCHRSMALDADASTAPWVAACHARVGDGPVEDLALPWTEVAPHWRPALLSDGDEGLVALWSHNPEGTVVGGKEGDEALRAAWWHDGAWERMDLHVLVSFATDVTAVRAGSEIVAVVAAGEPGRESRHARRLYVARLSLETGTWSPLSRLELEAPGDDWSWRIEHPSLSVDTDGIVHVAAVGQGQDTTWLVRARSADGGRTWQQTEVPAEIPPLLPHLAPVARGHEVVFGAWDAERGEAVVCSLGGEASADCQGTASPRLRSLQLEGPRIHVVVDQGSGDWVPETLDL